MTVTPQERERLEEVLALPPETVADPPREGARDVTPEEVEEAVFASAFRGFLTRAREALGLSGAQAARRAGLHRQRLHQIEHLGPDLSLRVLVRTLTRLGYDVELRVTRPGEGSGAAAEALGELAALAEAYQAQQRAWQTIRTRPGGRQLGTPESEAIEHWEALARRLGGLDAGRLRAVAASAEGGLSLTAPGRLTDGEA